MSKYKNLLKHPTVVNAYYAGLLMGAGDSISQIFLERDQTKQFSFGRAARFAAIGFCIVGPSLHRWYSFLDKRLHGKKFKGIKKVTLDQCCFAPCFIVVIMTAFGIVERNNLQSIQENIKKHYMDILRVNYSLWPAVQLINFTLIPLQRQVLFAQTVALFWNTYLSWKTHSEQDNEE